MSGHEGHGGHDGHEGPGGGEHAGHEGHSMEMTFVTGSSVVMLWNWHVDGAGEMFGACVAMFISAILYEGLKYLRERLLFSGRSEKGECSGPQCGGPPANARTAILNCRHFVQTLLHLLQVSISYVLMLVVMTYNVWLCLAIILGASVGYFLFGWIRNSSYEVTEHCH